MSYQDTLSKHRRLAILRHLAHSAAYTSNASILVDVCNGVGVTSSRAQIEADLGWLEEVSLVTLARAGDFIVVSATERGVEVAEGRAFNDGVQRPRPGAC